MTTWRECPKCKKIILMSYHTSGAYESWKGLFKKEDICKCDAQNTQKTNNGNK